MSNGDIVRWWHSFTRKLLSSGDTASKAWSRTWGIVLFCCFLLSWLRGTAPAIDYEWIEYAPGAILCEVVLIILLFRVRFLLKVPVWRLSLLPLVGIWVPFTVQTIFATPFKLLGSLIAKFTGFQDFPQLSPPWAYGHLTAIVTFCLVCSLVIYITALLIESLLN